MIIYISIITKLYIYIIRINPQHKELQRGLQDAQECSRSIRDGDVAVQRAHWQAGRDLFSQAIRFAENAPNLLLKRANCQFHMGDMELTIADSGRVLKMDSNNIPALLLRGQSYYVLGEFESSMTHYRQGLKLDPEHSGCKNEYRKLKKIQGLQSKAQKASITGDYEKAIQYLQDVISHDPIHRINVPQSNIDIAEYYLKLKKNPEAKNACNNAILFDDNNFKSHHIMGLIYMDSEEYDQASAQFRRALELNPGII
jgi:tetratricopeptide (TPR) repeat protein